MARKSRRNTELIPSVTPATKTWNVGAYVRLSAVDKKQKGDSIENQQAIIAAFCEEHKEFVISQIYIDNGISGQTLERPAFQRMLADMESGLINGCVAKDLSRYGRSAIDTGYYIEKYFPSHGIRCIAINDNYDSNDTHNSSGLMVNLKNLVNESYALEIGRKIHATKQMNIKNGCFIGALPPYGYLKSPEDNHKLIPDPIAAPIVTKMFEMAADGTIASVIHKWLMSNDILPPMKHFCSIGIASEKRAQGVRQWNIGAVYTILKNRIYTGDMVQGKGRTQSYKVEFTQKSDWIITPNTHEPLVSYEIFTKVQDCHFGKKSPSKSNGNNIFLGKIFCGHCGHAMSRTKSGKTSYLFKCDTRFRYGKDDCVIVSINEDKLKSILLEIIRAKAAIYCTENPIIETTQNPSELQNISYEIKRVNGFLKGLYESFADDIITRNEYHEMKLDYETKIATLTEQEYQLRESARERISKQSALYKINEQLGTINIITDINKNVIETLIEKIVVFEDKHIEVGFKFTDKITEEKSEK